MAWIADHILWLLIAGWILSLLLAARASVALWRWFRAGRGAVPRRWLRLAGAVVLLVLGGLGLFVASSGLVAMGPGLLAQRGMIGDPAPPLAYRRVADDAPATLTDHSGSVVLVNHWATWCPPCRKEMPDLDRLQERYRDQGLVIVHISDEPADVLVDYLAEHPMSTVHGQAAPLPWPDTGRPTTYLVDRTGVVQAVAVGDRSFEQFEAMVTPYL